MTYPAPDREKRDSFFSQLSSAKKVWAVFTGILAIGVGVGVWYANLSTTYATRTELASHRSDNRQQITDVKREIRDLERRVSNINKLSEVNGARIEMLLLFEERDRAGREMREIIDRRIRDLRSGEARPNTHHTNPLDALEGGG